MTLIDADELLEATDSDITKCSYNKTISRFDVITCPTIDAVVIPPKATNGDMVKAIFPDTEIEEIGDEGAIQSIAVSIGYGTSYFALGWWNAPYKKDVNKYD